MKLYKIETIAKIDKGYYVESELDINELVDNNQLINGFVGFDINTGTEFGVPNTSIESITKIEYNEEINDIIAKNKKKAKFKYYRNKIKEDFSTDNLSEEDLVSMLIGLHTTKNVRLELQNTNYTYLSSIHEDYLQDNNLIYLDYKQEGPISKGVDRRIKLRMSSEKEVIERIDKFVFSSIVIGKYTIYYPMYAEDAIQHIFQVLFILGKESLAQEV